MSKQHKLIIMKLLKLVFAIAVIGLITVSCKNEKKDAPSNQTEKANHVCNENCKEGNCPHHAKTAEHKCSENCKEGNCPHHTKTAEHKCDGNCKEGNCPHHAKDGEHKCTASKCSADCTDKDCEKCKEKRAKCKASCEAKKA